jgi:hypothetical protein
MCEIIENVSELLAVLPTAPQSTQEIAFSLKLEAF